MFDRVKRLLKRAASLQITIVLLAFFAVLLFWGVLYQSKVGVDLATERFFGSFFIWVFDVIPLPGLYSLLVVSAIHLILSMLYRIPQQKKSIGLYMMHLALLILILGGLIGGFSRVPLKGYGVVDGKTDVVFERSSEDYEIVLNDSLSFPLPPWGELKSFQLGPYDFKMILSCEEGYPIVKAKEERLILKNASGFQGFECRDKKESVQFPGIVLVVKHNEFHHEEKILLGLNERRPYILTGGEQLRLSNWREKMPFSIQVISVDKTGADVLISEKGDSFPRRIALNVPYKSSHYSIYFSTVLDSFDDQKIVLFKAKKDLFDFVPYLFTILLLAGLALHYLILREGKKS